MEKEICGVVREIFIDSVQPEPGLTRVHEVPVTLEGFLGDRHSGLTRTLKSSTREYPAGTVIRNSRQVSIVSVEELSEIAEGLEVSEVCASMLRANLLLEGIPSLSLLPNGTRLLFSGGAGLVVEGYNPPCLSSGQGVAQHFPNQEKLAVRFVKAAHLRRGIVAWVECAGTIGDGDEVRVCLPVQYSPSSSKLEEKTLKSLS